MSKYTDSNGLSYTLKEYKNLPPNYPQRENYLTIKNIEKIISVDDFNNSLNSVFDLKCEISHTDTQESHYTLLVNFGFEDPTKTAKVTIYRVAKYYIDYELYEKTTKIPIFDLMINKQATEYFSSKDIESPKKLLDIIKKSLEKLHTF